ncbi:putative global transcription activator SNF2L2 [Aphis craccivora]|uniref:Putative global transcription activator SNF2L2 n=1 Tax=Aphis craccivora TaxID=307492 RepID=A0A6G0VPK0_APHCR|nr:putative global transcription activator SNF2L2 [Aphis craccivora]
MLCGSPGATQVPRGHVPTSVPRDSLDELGVEGFSVRVVLPLGHLLIASRLPPDLPAPTVQGQSRLKASLRRSNLAVGDWVYYKAHPQSSAEKRFHAGFAPKWLGPFKLGKHLGTGVFLTEGKHPTKLHVSAMKRAMAERANLPPPNRNHRPSRGMIATHVERLRAVAGKLLREARRLSRDGPEDAVSGWSAERSATASFGRIQANPTAWALFERGFAEGRWSTRAITPQPVAARTRAGPPGRAPPRRAAPDYQRQDVRDGRGRFRRPAVEPQPAPPPEPVAQHPPQQPQQPPQQPPAQQPTVEPHPARQPEVGNQEQQLAVVERWIETMEVASEAPHSNPE